MFLFLNFVGLVAGIPALRALARGEIHIAGCNFKDNVTGQYNIPLVKEIVPFPCTIIRFTIWRPGMMVPETGSFFLFYTFVQPFWGMVINVGVLEI
jgi:molybdate-binding protein